MLTFFETQNPHWITRREVREQLKWPDKRTRDALDELVELEFLEVNRGARNLFTFQLAEIASAPASRQRLMHPDELASLLV